jgi:hypothetical protein
LGGYLDEVKAISADLHLQALNAIIRTATLGRDGGTLEVLSIQVQALARDSGQLAAEIVETLEALLKHAEATHDRTGETSLQERDLHHGLERIIAAHDDLRQTSRTAAELLAQQKVVLAESQVRLEFLGRLAETIQGEVLELTTLRETVARWKTTEPTLSDTIHQAMTRRYTMQSEREVHRQSENPGASPPPNCTPEISEDNLELFETPLVAGGSDAPPKSAQAAAPSTEKTGKPEALRPAKTAAESGDNLEFF